jgi:hypothetical protein
VATANARIVSEALPMLKAFGENVAASSSSRSMIPPPPGGQPEAVGAPAGSEPRMNLACVGEDLPRG